jgi:hypothetical protein
MAKKTDVLTKNVRLDLKKRLRFLSLSLEAFVLKHSTWGLLRGCLAQPLF